MGIRVSYSKSISLRTAAILVVIGAIFLLAKGFYRAGEWETFDSNPTRYTTEYPDGYTIEYPANWDAKVYKGYHNRKDLRAVFRQPFSSNPRALEVYWYSQNGMDSQSIIEWGDEIMSGWTTPKTTPPVTLTIGAENYAAIKNIPISENKMIIKFLISSSKIMKPLCWLFTRKSLMNKQKPFLIEC